MLIIWNFGCRTYPASENKIFVFLGVFEDQEKDALTLVILNNGGNMLSSYIRSQSAYIDHLAKLL